MVVASMQKMRVFVFYFHDFSMIHRRQKDFPQLARELQILYRQLFFGNADIAGPAAHFIQQQAVNIVCPGQGF